MKGIQAKHITDEDFLASLRADIARRNTLGACWWTMAQHDFPGLPPKVVLAKAKALIRRDVITGCACGCRGDFAELDDEVARTR